MHRISAVAVVVLLSAAACAQVAAQIWSQEQVYWKYVQANDLEAYRSLWHADFLGWLYVSPEPVRKDHITDWMTVHTSKGETFKLKELERLAIQVTDKYATTTYRVRGAWIASDGERMPVSIRVIHTWLRGTDGKWQIISGMSAPVNAEGK